MRKLAHWKLNNNQKEKTDMKKKIILTAGFVLAIIIGCTNDEIIPIEGSDVLTRAVAQTIFSNQTVTSNRTVTGTDILSEHITVSNGAKLILKGSQSITINKPYTIEKGCQLEITH